MKKKVVALMTIATMAASLFAGCGEQTQNVGGGTETGNQAASGEKETMNIHLNGIDEDYKMQKAIEEIQTMSEYQNVEFNFVGREADFNTTVPTQIAAGNQIDIIVVANPMLQQQYSLAASLGQGLLVYLAQRRKEEGADFDSVAQWTEEHKKNIVHLFTVDDLNHLYRGGRVSRTTAILGGMLNIKPILHVDDEGKLIPIGKVRGRKKSLLELVTLMDTKIGSYAKSCDTIFISHGDCREEAEFLAAKVKEKYHITTELINDVGAVIGAHTGPGTMALFFVGDVR